MPFNIGPGELIIVLVIALIVVGPGKLPDVGRGARQEHQGVPQGRDRRQGRDRAWTPRRRPPSPPAVAAAPPRSPRRSATPPAPNVIADTATPNTIAAAAAEPNTIAAAPVAAEPAPAAGRDAGRAARADGLGRILRREPAWLTPTPSGTPAFPFA